MQIKFLTKHHPKTNFYNSIFSNSQKKLWDSNQLKKNKIILDEKNQSKTGNIATRQISFLFNIKYPAEICTSLLPSSSSWYRHNCGVTEDETQQLTAQWLPVLPPLYFASFPFLSQSVNILHAVLFFPREWGRSYSKRTKKEVIDITG